MLCCVLLCLALLASLDHSIAQSSPESILLVPPSHHCIGLETATYRAATRGVSDTNFHIRKVSRRVALHGRMMEFFFFVWGGFRFRLFLWVEQKESLAFLVSILYSFILGQFLGFHWLSGE